MPATPSFQDASVTQIYFVSSGIFLTRVFLRKVCLEGAGILIADGECELWHRPWIPGREFDEIRDSFHFIPNQAFCKVKDLFQEDTRLWNENLITACFEPQIAEEILRIKPIDEGRDILFWKAAKSGKFTVKSAYWVSQKNRFNESQPQWKRFWKTKIHPRLKLFSWKLFSDILPTKSRIGILPSDQQQCIFCESEVESAFHLFCQCSFTRAIWFRKGIRLERFQWQNLDEVKRWWSNLDDIEMQTLFACTREIIWKWRNDKVFRDVKVELTTVFQDCKRRTEDFLSNRVWCEEEVELQTPVKSDNTKNLEGYWECYVDASVVEKYAGYAIVHKQEEPPCDYWIATEVSKVESVFEGELCGIKLALQSALDQKANSIHIKTDSKNAATAFEIGSIPFGWHSYPLFKQCQTFC